VVEREGVTRRALLTVGSHDKYFAQRLRGLRETLDAVRQNPVVVGDEKAHERDVPLQRGSGIG